jgi:hypothetical protein
MENTILRNNEAIVIKNQGFDPHAIIPSEKGEIVCDPWEVSSVLDNAERIIKVVIPTENERVNRTLMTIRNQTPVTLGMSCNNLYVWLKEGDSLSVKEHLPITVVE